MVEHSSGRTTVSRSEKSREIFFPVVYGEPHLWKVGVTVVNRRHAGETTRRMVQEFFGDVERHAQSGKVGAKGSPEVVQRERFDFQPFVKERFGLGSAVEVCSAFAANMRAGGGKEIRARFGDGFDNRFGQRSEWESMRSLVFGD